MYPRLTPRMDQIIKLSQQIAREYEQDYVGTEHLLLAILREGTGVGAAVLNDAEVTLSRAKEIVDKHMKASMEDTWVFGRLPGSPHYRNVVALAIDEATQLEAKKIGSEHLLLALLREENSTAQRVLAKLGVTLKAARQEVLKLIS